MSDGATHSAVGCFVGLSTALLDQKSSGEFFQNLILATSTSTVFSKLPDILEPASNPHHRQFFHSLVVLSALGVGVKRIYDWETEGKFEAFLRVVLLSAGAGYISHLLLDFTTPRSLPLLGKL